MLNALNTFGANGLLSRRPGGSATSFYTFDPSGNVCQRLTSTGAVSSTDVYEAFGQPHTGNTSDPWEWGAQWGYYTDTGGFDLVLCGHRWYDPSTGRWFTRDPMGYGGGIDLYDYCGNDPVDSADATGFKPSPGLGCSGKDVGMMQMAIHEACSQIEAMPAAPGKGNGLRCPTQPELNCLKRLCHSGMPISCNQGCPPPKNGKYTAGDTFVGGLGEHPANCNVNICTGNINSGNGFDPGVSNSTDEIALTIIHEMLHCCGRTDKGGPKGPGSPNQPSDPAQNGANCCMGISQLGTQ